MKQMIFFVGGSIVFSLIFLLVFSGDLCLAFIGAGISALIAVMAYHSRIVRALLYAWAEIGFRILKLDD